MKNIHIIIYMLLMLTAMACRDHAEEILPDREEGPVLAFLTDASDRSTRASQEVTGSLLHDLGYETFGIWTWRTANGTDWRTVMDGYHVSYDAKYVGEGRTEYGWGYDQEAGFEHQVLKYWNLSYQKYQFHGYAPWVGTTVSANPYVSVDDSRKLLFHNVSGHFATQSAVTEYSIPNKDIVDWLYTYVERSMTGFSSPALTIDRDLSEYDRVTPSNTGKWLYIGNTDATAYKLVPLRFHHLLPKVVFRLKVYDGTNEELEIYQSIGLSVKTHEDALDHTKNTKLITKGETVDYYPTFTGGTFPVSTAYYVSGTKEENTREFVDKTMFPLFDYPAFKSFKKSNGTQTVDVSPYVLADGKPTREGWLELPQKAPAFDVKLSFGGVTYARTLDPAINLALPQLWEPDHIYIYEIKFNVSAPTLEVTSYMEEWNSESGDFNLSDW